MDKSTPNITIELLTEYSAQDAAALGHLLSQLSDSFSGEPVDNQIINDIITSPYHDQLVARDSNGNIIGTITVTLIMGAGILRKAWAEDFVVDPAVQGGGVGSRLWDALIIWCQDHQVDKLEFTSHPSKVAAQQFYAKRGAVIRETNLFHKKIMRK